MFELTYAPILIHPMKSDTASAGGWVSFEGRVRNTNEGKSVIRLEYEAYESLAITEGNKILAEAKSTFGLVEAYGIHRYGALALGETAIWVYAAAKHRREAFEGVEYIVHTIKHALPVWKKEWYEDGTSQWVNCNHAL